MKTFGLQDYSLDVAKLLKDVNYRQLCDVAESIGRSLLCSSVWVAGNAGSFLTACHFAEDVLKGLRESGWGYPLRIAALGANPGLQMAIANDIGWQDIFVYELQSFAKPNDMLISLSVSGNSKNVVRAVEWANKNKMKTVSIVGFSGNNNLGKISQNVIAIDSEHFGKVEDVTMSLLHNIAYHLKDGEW